MIALSIPSLDQPYFAELAQDVIRVARDTGLTVFVETTESDKQRELATLDHFGADVVDGVIFAPNVIGRDATCQKVGSTS
jgi:DNA-binding LacI/PurR family transcriptional regulator